MGRKSLDEITLEDVELAIKILEEFLRRVNKAKITLRRVYSIVGARRGQDAMVFELARDIVLHRRSRKVEVEAEIEEPEITEEDIERFRKVKEKIEKKELKPVS
ncbi:MAG: hypothetical protein DRO23_07055 [Thermoprotei archaeon]|nr:MAG: hypothetical protein DRO23_07055 [Thermoprotei archaeon]